ncbi:MAG TPA: hypothetical protein VG844_08040 [Terracidiphilus sp.]|nr:hypothetical protein [Terracidiphilus sp.]
MLFLIYLFGVLGALFLILYQFNRKTVFANLALFSFMLCFAIMAIAFLQVGQYWMGAGFSAVVLLQTYYAIVAIRMVLKKRTGNSEAQS